MVSLPLKLDVAPLPSPPSLFSSKAAMAPATITMSISSCVHHAAAKGVRAYTKACAAHHGTVALATHHLAHAEYEKCKVRDALDRVEWHKTVTRENCHNTRFYAAKEPVAAPALATPVAAPAVSKDALSNVSEEVASMALDVMIID